MALQSKFHCKYALYRVVHFWRACCAQGDEEKAAGMTPIAMMDREKQHELPQLEVKQMIVLLQKFNITITNWTGKNLVDINNGKNQHNQTKYSINSPVLLLIRVSKSFN